VASLVIATVRLRRFEGASARQLNLCDGRRNSDHSWRLRGLGGKQPVMTSTRDDGRRDARAALLRR
jgi:hypothetical protein